MTFESQKTFATGKIENLVERGEKIIELFLVVGVGFHQVLDCRNRLFGAIHPTTAKENTQGRATDGDRFGPGVHEDFQMTAMEDVSRENQDDTDNDSSKGEHDIPARMRKANSGRFSHVSHGPCQEGVWRSGARKNPITILSRRHGEKPKNRDSVLGVPL